MAASAENANPPKVIVVGAGPVGLFVALQLAQAGILVEVMEKEAALSDAPRAAGYHGETMLALARAKVLEKARRQGTDTTGFCWRKPLADDGNGGKRYGDIIARMPLTRRDSHSADGFASLLILPQSKLAKLFIDDALATGLVKVYFNMELTAIQDDGQSVKATFTKPGGGLQETHEGLFLVGADGGKSTTRKLLDIPFKGFSWPERLVAMDCVFATPETMETEFSTSCIVHPTNFGVLVPLEPFEPGRRSLYRCSAAVDPHDSRSDDELVSEESLDDLLDMMVPGPRPLNVEVVRAAPYRIHQLCASTFRRGRCLLAGDAAHLSNPFGALGLSSGLLDAEAVADTLALVINEGKPLSLLDTYSIERQRVFQTITSPTSSLNKLRCAADPERADEDWLIRLLQTDPAALWQHTKHLHENRTDMRSLAANLPSSS